MKKKSPKPNSVLVTALIRLCLVVLAALCLRFLSDAGEVPELFRESPLPVMILRYELGMRPVAVPEAAGEPIAVPEPEPTPEPEQNTEDTPTGQPEEPPVEKPQEEQAGEAVEETPPEPVIRPDEPFYADAGTLTVKNSTAQTFDAAALMEKPLGFDSGAHILIIHTHSTEAYTGEYDATEPYRTLDEESSVIRVGDELEAVLTQAGLTVIHDRGIYDYPDYNLSYTNAGAAIKRNLAEDPEIGVVIDLHRDAIEGANGEVYKTLADLGGESSAQIMLIVGSNDSGLEHPGWRDNLGFALKLQARMELSAPTLARPVYISRYRYNQNAAAGSLIVEVGSNGNTLEEAIEAAKHFGQVLIDVLEYESLLQQK